MQTYQSSKCPVCLEAFSAFNHIPKIFPDCGHTVCEECLIQILKTEKPTCPLDQLKFSKNFRTLNAFPTNLLGKNLLELESQSKWSQCSLHLEPKKFICLTDQTLICANCIIFGEHKDHKVKLFSDCQDIAKQKKKQLKDISSKISQTFYELRDLLEAKKQQTKNIIQERCETLRLEITKQEVEMLVKLDNTFEDERTRLHDMMSQEFELQTDIDKKEKELSNQMSSPNIAKLVEEDFSDIERKLDESLLDLREKQTMLPSEILSIFQEALPKEDFLKELNNIELLDQQLLTFNEKWMKKQEISSLLTFDNSYFKIVEESETPVSLRIEASHYPEPCFFFQRAKLEHCKSFHIDMFDNGVTIDEGLISDISRLTKHLIKVTSVEINMDSIYFEENPPDQLFFKLLYGIFSPLENLEHIEINIQSWKITDIGLLIFAERFLPRFKNLKTFIFYLNGIKTTGHILKSLAKINLSNYPNLWKFHLCLPKTPLNKEYVVQFLSKIPNVKELMLRFGETSLTDQELESFSTQTLPSLSRLKNLEIKLWKNKITDAGVQSLLANIPSNVTQLDIGFSGNKITDASMQDFMQRKLPLLANLKELNLDLSSTDLSDSLIDKINEWKEKISANISDYDS